MARFVVIGERIHCISPVIREAMAKRDPEPILKRAREQLDAGATYLDLNIGPAERDGEELMKWGVQLLQSNFDNVPLALDTANMKAIEAGISVYNRSKGKPIVNSADAGERIENIDLAAANDAITIALCQKHGIPADNDERMAYCQEMLERGDKLSAVSSRSESLLEETSKYHSRARDFERRLWWQQKMPVIAVAAVVLLFVLLRVFVF